MKTGTILPLLAAAVLSGCFSVSSPYDHIDSWLIRDDPVRAFAIPSDVIYVQNDLYVSGVDVPSMKAYAKMEVGNGRFDGLARVFSPMIANLEDVEAALGWYFRYHHEKRRPFFFIGEGEGGRLLREYERTHGDKLRRLGLVDSYYSETSSGRFVTSDMVHAIKDSLARYHYRSVWGRDMPEPAMAQPADETQKAGESQAE